MKVKISRRVELEKVPSMVSEILDPAEETLVDVLSWVKALSAELKSNKVTASLAMLQIQRLKAALIDVEQSVVDAEGIISGLAEYEQSIQLQDEQVPEQQEEIKDEPDLPF